MRGALPVRLACECSLVATSRSAGWKRAGTMASESKAYSTAELDKIISDIFALEKGGSASESILPEGDVCRLCDMAKEILQREDNVKAVQTPVMVVGDGSCPCFHPHRTPSCSVGKALGTCPLGASA